MTIADLPHAPSAVPPTNGAPQQPPPKQESAYTTALAQFDRAAQILDLDPGMASMLRSCKRELTVNFPVKLSLIHI